MKKVLLVLVSIAGISAAVAGGLIALDHTHTKDGKTNAFTNGHSGGTDSMGCHVDSRNGLRHCH